MVRNSFAVAFAAALALVFAPALHAQLNYETSLANAINEVTIPEGTEFKLDLHTDINSKTARAGDVVITTLIDPVYVEDQEVLPKGLRVDGRIIQVKKAKRRGRGGRLSISFNTVTLPNGQKIAILGSLADIFSTPGSDNSTVGIEGDLKGSGASKKEQVAIFLGAAGAGATGGIGTGIAAGVGGLVAALVLPRGKQAFLSAGSLIGMRLDEDVSFIMPHKSKKSSAPPSTKH